MGACTSIFITLSFETNNIFSVSLLRQLQDPTQNIGCIERRKFIEFTRKNKKKELIDKIKYLQQTVKTRALEAHRAVMDLRIIQLTL
jgi:hypothetical protein